MKHIFVKKIFLEKRGFTPLLNATRSLPQGPSRGARHILDARWIRNSQVMGFTLIESLVAIGVLAIVIVAPMTIAQKGLQSTYHARDQITAFYLAQEVVEYVRALRDGNKLAGNTNSSITFPGGYWLGGLESCIHVNSPSAGLCDVNSSSDEVKFFSSGTPVPNLWHDNSGGGYRQTNGVASNPFTERSKFRREMDIFINTAQRDEAKVTVRVFWRSSIYSAERSVTLSETIFNL